jgi:hypothetical protein
LEELRQLQSPLAGQEPVNPYVVPVGYFDQLINEFFLRLKGRDAASPAEEIETLSPLLAGLRKQMPYSVPDGYFERSPEPVKTETKIVSMNPRRWFRYVAAVLVVGMLVLSGLVILRNNDLQKMGFARFEKKLSREIDRMTDVELKEFLDQTDPILAREQTAQVSSSNEVSALLEDIPVSELTEFIEETTVIDTEEVLLN